ncbi:hypothetical protein N0V86_006627 [Didymella sp. IMI 355093]|nr:hypothetical protein N0V86_006627 [Didymella sp. IMI 355093]
MKVTCIFVPTATQTAKEKDKNRAKSHMDDINYKQLTEDVSFLRQQLTTLIGTVAALAERRDSQPSIIAERTPTLRQTASPAHTGTTSQRPPQQPQFAGPTRAAFSLNIVETSLNRMGIPSDVHDQAGHTSSVSSREATPEPTTALAQTLLQSGVEGLQDISNDDINRLLGIYQEEVASVHPIIETKDLIANAPAIMDLVRNPHQATGIQKQRLGKKDIHILRLAVATAITHEIHGKNLLSDRLLFEVEQDVGRISSETEVELKDIQIMGMLSLYFCHTEEELFAWRAIGRACRQALEMGLHRKQSLHDNFDNPEERKLAVQVFWVVYELDRRWSFGTSLSFALNDRDIDTQLPEPGKAYPYLKSMVGYARLCSRVWESLPPYGSPLQTIPKETEDYLDFSASNWLLSIPQELQFRHPRLSLAPKSQPRLLHRLRTLLYLRGNHMRTLIHRHHVLTPDNIKADLQSARLVVDIAEDSILVLVHLNETSDIYARQQSIYHYYLLSALAVLLLAVCHAPSVFAEACRDSFISAVELVKGFSHHGTASRRLWKSIKGLVPVVRSLGMHREPGIQGGTTALRDVTGPSTANLVDQTFQLNSNPAQLPKVGNGDDFNIHTDLGSMPDIFNIGDELIDLYDAFGTVATTQPSQQDPSIDNFGEQGLSVWEIGEITRHFQGLI